jgi:phosphoribosylanthranilate isomerase
VTRVKLCGLTSEADVALCAAAGADALGFVVEYPLPVPWTLDRRRAAALMRGVPPFVTRVAVVGGDAATIVAIAEETGADVLQLHLDEDEATVAAVRERLPGTQVVKAIRIRAGETPPAAEVAAAGRRFVDAGADAILLDSKTEGRAAGTGIPVDWALARDVAAALGAPLVLAGGLTPENVAEAIAKVRPWGVDVASGVESIAGRKDARKVREFIRNAKQAAPRPYTSAEDARPFDWEIEPYL